MVCPAAFIAADVAYFGWVVGNISGTFAAVSLTFLTLTARAYEWNAAPAVSQGTRTTIQWILWGLPSVLFVAWAWSGYCVGWSELPTFIVTASLGVVASLAPIILLFMLTAAGIVGKASARR